MVHVLLVGTWPSRSCAIDSAVSNMAESLCLCRDLAFALAHGASQHPVESEVIWGLRWGLPQVEPCLPSRACKYSSGLTGGAYRACGEAASALHAMALLQVHQAKALRNLHEGGHDLAVLHELRAATDLALRATKVTAQSLGRAMSTLVVQERHLWLCLTDMKEQEKVQFLNAPVSQTGLFGDAVESCAQQFSAAQKQTEAIKHIMRRRKPAAASTPAAAPQPARRCGRPLSGLPPLPRRGSSLPLCGVMEPVTGRTAQPVQAPAKPGGKRKCKSHPTWRLRSLPQGTRVTYVTETFFFLHLHFFYSFIYFIECKQ